jgi:hypothetical protein
MLNGGAIVGVTAFLFLHKTELLSGAFPLDTFSRYHFAKHPVVGSQLKSQPAPGIYSHVEAICQTP